jgi:hypothetical protein
MRLLLMLHLLFALLPYVSSTELPTAHPAAGYSLRCRVRPAEVLHCSAICATACGAHSTVMNMLLLLLLLLLTVLCLWCAAAGLLH